MDENGAFIALGELRVRLRDIKYYKIEHNLGAPVRGVKHWNEGLLVETYQGDKYNFPDTMHDVRALCAYLDQHLCVPAPVRQRHRPSTTER